MIEKSPIYWTNIRERPIKILSITYELGLFYNWQNIGAYRDIVDSILRVWAR